MRKNDGLKFLLDNFPNITVDTVFVNDFDSNKNELLLTNERQKYWRVRCGKKIESELKLPMASLYTIEELEKFIKYYKNKFNDIYFIVHRIDNDYFYPKITGSLAVYNNANIPKIVIELQEVTKEMLDNIDIGKRPRDWDISVCLQYDFLYKIPKVTFYKDINMDNLKTAINTLYYIGTKIFDLYCQMNIYEPSYTRFNIYDDSSIILNDHRSQESFIKTK